MDNDKDAQSVPLTDSDKIPPLEDNLFTNDEKPPPYEALTADGPVQGRVHFQRSQSLPQLSTDRLPEHTIPRIRYLSGEFKRSRTI